MMEDLRCLEGGKRSGFIEGRSWPLLGVIIRAVKGAPQMIYPAVDVTIESAEEAPPDDRTRSIPPRIEEVSR